MIYDYSNPIESDITTIVDRVTDAAIYKGNKNILLVAQNL